MRRTLLAATLAATLPLSACGLGFEHYSRTTTQIIDAIERRDYTDALCTAGELYLSTEGEKSRAVAKLGHRAIAEAERMNYGQRDVEAQRVIELGKTLFDARSSGVHAKNTATARGFETACNAAKGVW